ncbi:aspartic peptidase domain-containing protein [Mycena rosella]|uniref:Aspartic peptidase domain-containing protein n=1 Tax=Mycena rosella TaxID=1033263 RepID=A0AAD7DWA8_MYCRO|nr:aspartic peptidase domain-containing protein [Mycena rosella]
MLRFPVPLLSFLFLHLELWAVSAKPGRRPQYTVDADNNIINNYNDRYTLNLTVAGTPVNVILDTGSTDMWVAPPTGISGSFKDTGASATIAYGDGSNFVNGTIGVGLVEIAGFSIPDQAFINVTNSVGGESDVAGGIFGLVGFGFDGPGGSIPSALTAVGFNGTDVGKSVLSSIFDQDSTKGRFFAFSLSRVGDVNDSADASLVISGYDDHYTAVQFAPILTQFPPNNGGWSVLSEGVSVGGQPIDWSAFDTTTPTGNSIVLFDTGTTNFLVPAQIRDAIYSAVPGAVLAKNSSIPNTKFSEDEDVWVVPCSTPVNFTTKFAGQEFPIHPLDLTDLTVLLGPDGKNYTVCTGSITNGGSILGPGLDALYGDSFLRNVYSVFSFGNDTTLPYVQLLSQTDAGAAADFYQVRAEILASSPNELSPEEIIDIFDGSSSNTSITISSSSTPTSATGSSTSTVSTDSSTPTLTTDSPTPTVATDSSAPTSAFASVFTATTSSAPLPECTSAASSDALASSGKVSVNLADSGSGSDTESTTAKYGLIIITLLVANLVVLLVVAFLGVMSFARTRRTTGSTRALNPQYAPVQLKEDAPRSSFSTADHRAYTDY